MPFGHLEYQRELDDLGPFVAREALHMMLGEKLGAGSTRRVYVNDLNKQQVIKVDLGGQFSNVMEWNMWHELKDTPLGKWLAPCDFISPAGEMLIQRRTYQPKSFPSWIPSIFCDTKLTNFGVLPDSDQLVCHDYGMMRLDKLLNTPRTRFSKADWWRLGQPE